MEVYSRNGEDWQDCLQRKAIAEDLPSASQQIREEISCVVKPQMDVVSQEMSEDSVGLDLIPDGIAGLKSAFDIAMGNALWKMQLQQKSLSEFLAEIRRTEVEHEAEVYRQRAEAAYTNGWYEEALNDFVEAERQNYQDFSVLRSIGNIYLYVQYDLTKAARYYEKSAKYAVPYSKEHAAESLLFASWACYLQRDDTAVEHAKNAFHMNPSLTEAYYLDFVTLSFGF